MSLGSVFVSLFVLLYATGRLVADDSSKVLPDTASAIWRDVVRDGRNFRITAEYKDRADIIIKALDSEYDVDILKSLTVYGPDGKVAPFPTAFGVATWTQSALKYQPMQPADQALNLVPGHLVTLDQRAFDVRVGYYVFASAQTSESWRVSFVYRGQLLNIPSGWLGDRIRVFAGLDDYAHRVEIYTELFIDSFFLAGVDDGETRGGNLLEMASNILEAYDVADSFVEALEGTREILSRQEIENARIALESMWNEDLEDYVPVSPYSEVARWRAMHPPLPVRVLRGIDRTMDVLGLLQNGIEITGAGLRELALYDCLDEMAFLRRDAIGDSIDEISVRDPAIEAGFQAASDILDQMSKERHHKLRATLATLDAAQNRVVDIGFGVASLEGAFTSAATKAIAKPLYLSYKSYMYLRGKIFETQRSFAALTLYSFIVSEVLYAHQSQEAASGPIELDASMRAIMNFRVAVYFAWRFYADLRAAHDGLLSGAYFSFTDLFTDPTVSHAEYIETLEGYQQMCVDYLHATRPPYYLARAKNPLAGPDANEEWTWIRELLLPEEDTESDGSGKLDCVLCIDKSGSMADDIEVVKTNSEAILNLLNDYASEEDISLQVGLVMYSRHTDEDWLWYRPLTANWSEIKQNIKDMNITDLSVGGGGNEDIYGALLFAMNQEVDKQKIEMGWRTGEPSEEVAVYSENPASTGAQIALGDREGAAKIIITMGDEPPNEDLTDCTLERVAQVAKDLDPVHVYPLLLPKQGSSFLDPAVRGMERVAKATDGQVVRVDKAEDLPEAIVATVKLAVHRHRNEVWRESHPPYVLYGGLFFMIAMILTGVISLFIRTLSVSKGD